MNDAQHGKYMYHWGQARRKMRAEGKSPKECDEFRYQIHFMIGAVWVKFGKLSTKSSKVFNNKNVDDFIAACEAIANAGDLQIQLDQMAMPQFRALHATRRLLDVIGIAEGEDTRVSYLEGILRKDLDKSTDSDLQRLIIACNHTAMHKTGKQHNHPRTGKGPQSKYAHQVGSRSSMSPPPNSEPTNRINREKYQQAQTGI